MNILEELSLARLPEHRAMLRSRVRMRALRALPVAARRVVFRGDDRYCSLCRSRLSRFLPFGNLPDEWCPVCASMGRHRLMWTVLQARPDLLGRAPKRLLHFAPEPSMETALDGIPGLARVTADLHDPNADHQVDIRAMPFPDESFDALLCSHVLEHVDDDRAAIREIARVLRPGAWAIIMVPYFDGMVTDEDPSITDAAERERRFGQQDHVRFYGRDTPDRLAEPGLVVEAVRADAMLSPERLAREGVRADETAFVCMRPNRSVTRKTRPSAPSA
jgi:SAM-dependent methyltransferase